MKINYGELLIIDAESIQKKKELKENLVDSWSIDIDNISSGVPSFSWHRGLITKYEHENNIKKRDIINSMTVRDLFKLINEKIEERK